MQFDSTTMQMFIKGIEGILYMVFPPSVLSYVVGIPPGTTLMVTDRDGISPVLLPDKVLGLVTNVLRSIPFIILLIMVIPIARTTTDEIIGCSAIVVPLVIVTAFYIGRTVESSLKEVDVRVTETIKFAGASTRQITVKVLLPEVKPFLLVGAATSITATLGYPAMAGSTGGGGLGDIVIRYGHHRYQTDMIMAAIVLLVIIAQLIQEVFMRVSRKGDRRVCWSRACLIRTAIGEANKTEPVRRSR